MKDDKIHYPKNFQVSIFINIKNSSMYLLQKSMVCKWLTKSGIKICTYCTSIAKICLQIIFVAKIYAYTFVARSCLDWSHFQPCDCDL